MAQQVAIDAAAVPRVQRVERGGVARRVGQHQCLVAVVAAALTQPSRGSMAARGRRARPARCDANGSRGNASLEHAEVSADRARTRHRGERIRRSACAYRGPRQHAHRDQVLAPVVAGSRRRLRGVDVARSKRDALRVRRLVAAVAGARASRVERLWRASRRTLAFAGRVGGVLARARRPRPRFPALARARSRRGGVAALRALRGDLRVAARELTGPRSRGKRRRR